MQEAPLSREDRAILELEGPTIVGHTCKVVVLDPPRPPLSRLRGEIEERLPGAPQLLLRLADRGGEPVWVEDRRFDLGDHVVDGGSAADERAFRERIAALFAEHLERDRPLWRIDAIELPRGRLGLVWRLHHALADGTAAMRFGSSILWTSAAPSGTDGAPDRPTASAAGGRQAAAERADRRRRDHLGALIGREFAESVHSSPFDGEIGRRRAVAFTEVELDPLHDAARRLAAATVNDAVLCLVSGAIGVWLADREVELGRLRLRVPVSLHREGDDIGNRDSFFTIPAPVAEPDPLARLELIRAETERRKAGHDAERLDSLLDSLAAMSGRARELADRLEAGSRSFAVCVSNVPGPAEPIAVCGAPVRSLHTLAEVGLHHGLRVTVVSASGRLGFGFCADPAIVPDVERMASAIAPQAEALLAAG